MSKSFALVALLASLALVLSQPCSASITCDVKEALVDGVTIPFGSPVVCEGQFAEKEFMELSPGQGDLKLTRINGRGNQDDIVVHLNGVPKDAQPKPGQWLRVRGVLADGNVSLTPPELSLKAAKVEAIAAAPLTPADFIGREGAFEGIATSPDLLKTDPPAVLHVAKWPADIIGKQAHVHGKVAKTNDGFTVQTPHWSLLDPKDMLGQTVTLEGNVYELNGVWRFVYRNQDMILTDAHDHPAVLDGDRHGSRARVTGLIVKQLRPSLAQISLKTDRDLVPTYVIRRAKIDYPNPPVNDESEHP